MVKAVVDLYGRIDIIFNNAGFIHADWLEYNDPERDIETQVDVNLLGVIQITRAVLPYMFNREEGHIINMSSVAGWIAPPLLSIYSATKFGARAFTDALRRLISRYLAFIPARLVRSLVSATPTGRSKRSRSWNFSFRRWMQ